MKKIITSLSVSISLLLSLVTPSAAFAAPNSTSMPQQILKNHAFARLQTVNNSGVEGFASLRQLKDGGARISLIAFGMQPGKDYVSLYYSNHSCALEPYSASDVIGGIYTANGVGVGLTHGVVDDDLVKINSVSVRDANTFALLACADVHP